MALKIINKTQKNYQKVLDDLIKESSILYQLDHINIIKVFDFRTKGVLKKQGEIIEEDIAYAVMEVANKGEIFEIIYETGSLKENTVRYYLSQLIDVLDYLHDHNIVHRDLKPENILLGDNLEIKLADFGFATMVRDDEKNKTHLGTERYMCPELIMKK